jgi:hypothetical protein
MRVIGYWLGCNIWASTECILNTKSIKQGCAKFCVLPTILSVQLVTFPFACCNSGLIQMSVTFTQLFVTYVKMFTFEELY